MSQTLIRYSNIVEIVGDIIRVKVPESAYKTETKPCFGDLAFVDSSSSGQSIAQVINVKHNIVALQVFQGTKGISTDSSVRFLGHPMQMTYSDNILGRIFRGTGEPIDGGPDLTNEPKVTIGGPSVNPVRRVLASKMIRTDIPMIDVFNCLVESQKIPIFSVAGEPFNQFLARIGIQAQADVVVFGGLGLIFDEYYSFRSAFEAAGVSARTVMVVNLASHPIVERILVPDMVLAVAEHFAVEEGKRVLVLLSDMTAFADALKEIGIAMDQVPSNRGYMGDLYSQLARRYEKAADYAQGGSVTILTVTTMPGDDITHPVPDNTGYITEGQFYLHDGVIDPFGSLSRLKQHVIGKATREDHSQIMNATIRFYAGAIDAEQKQSMAFELSEFDRRLLKFGQLFRTRFMNIEVSMPLEEALDLAWKTLAECFKPEELLMKQALVDKYYPQNLQVADSKLANSESKPDAAKVA
ncbi:V-type ATP synthase subunit B [Synechococcus sp. PCC 7336]|uniref:V-type ATP synthase subunit B n=1 Tax=Synechococcus sp. PCC 7336 TaxID=195250 RepID=UPI0003484E1D|nr:V-type ATP synthase subunit B [Synechococcus sp. PCC 7336]